MTSVSSPQAQSFIYTSDFSKDDTLQLLARAKLIKSGFYYNREIPKSLQGCQIALFFSEASTRTKISFQMATQRMGGQCLLIDNTTFTSMSKGESFDDSFWTIQAMKPDAIIVRCGQDYDLDELAKRSEVPIINAGFGSKAHPTQALLDIMTLQEHRECLKQQKVLFVGDIKHSRVFASHRRLLPELGAEIGVCAPKEFLPLETAGMEVFSDLSKAMKWSTVYCGLRVQFERHSDDLNFTKDEFIQNYSLSSQRLQELKSDALIMHPGPVNWGLEFQTEVLKDPRLLLWQQKENGVYTRAALLEKLIGRP